VATSLSALSSAITFGTPLATTNINTALWPVSTATLTDNDCGCSRHCRRHTVFVGIAAWYSGGGQQLCGGGRICGPCGYVESTNSVALGGGEYLQLCLRIWWNRADQFQLGGRATLISPGGFHEVRHDRHNRQRDLERHGGPGRLHQHVLFWIWTTTNYSSYTGMTMIPIGTSQFAFSNIITGLSPGTLYHFQGYAYNHDGLANGGT